MRKLLRYFVVVFNFMERVKKVIINNYDVSLVSVNIYYVAAFINYNTRTNR